VFGSAGGNAGAIGASSAGRDAPCADGAQPLRDRFGVDHRGLVSGATSRQRVDDAQARFDAGDAAGCLQLALASLAERPDDAELHHLAGLAGLELGDVDAVGHLERAAALAPDDPSLLVDLGHALYGAGRQNEAIAKIRQATEVDLAHVGARRGLVDVLRRDGRLEEALAAATAGGPVPDDVLGELDVAELSLELGRLDDARAAFARLRQLDEEPEHEVYAYHGMIEAELRAGRFRRALDLAVDATRVDRLGRTTDVLSFVVAEVFGQADRPAPSREQVDETLARSRAEHRRLHSETLEL
jgi:Flp pilus assembly protein TadD